jgi:prolyl oligopeptidase
VSLGLVAFCFAAGFRLTKQVCSCSGSARARAVVGASPTPGHRSQSPYDLAGAIRLIQGSASVSLAVFALWPKACAPCRTLPNGDPATGALPIQTAWFPLRACFSFIALVVLIAGSVGAEGLAGYPQARRDEAMDDYNGVKVADPYRWLEQLDSPETRDWVRAEARLTDSYLEKIPVRDLLKQRLTALLDFEKFGMPFHKGNHYFYTHNSGLQQQSVILASLGLEGAPAAAFDPNALPTNGGTQAVVGYLASLDGGTLAYGVSQGGSDWTDWHFRDVASGRDLPDVLRWTKYYQPIFSTDGKGIYYSAFPAPAPGEELRVRDLGDAVFYHVLGTPASADRKLYGRPDHADWQFEPHLTGDGRWLVLRVGEGEVGDKGLENLYVLDLKTTEAVASALAEGFDANYHYVGTDQGLLYFQTTVAAPRGRVVAVDPSATGRPDWKEVVAQGADAMDVNSGSVTLVDHQLIVRTSHDVASKVAIYGLDGRLRREVELPGRGTAAGFGGEPDDVETFYSYTDMVTPTTIFRLDLETGASTVYRAPKMAFDTSALETKQVFYPAKDGTRIPMSLVYKKGIKLDGTNPTLLYGYGGFGNALLPRFDATRLVWLERGGIFAVANIRGGGEYGEEWHRQAIRAHKQIVFDDFIAAAEWLIAQGYTSTPKLAIEGGSNGGLLVGACVTQRPDLYGAALAYVGVMDMLRFDQFGQGAGWVGDYGVPHNPEDFKSLRAYSPYHNVRSGTRYPATLVITGDHDTRVMPAHSFKFAAALQFAQAGPAPVLLRVRLSTGHGAGATTSQLVAEKADAYAFLMENLGMDMK